MNTLIITTTFAFILIAVVLGIIYTLREKNEILPVENHEVETPTLPKVDSIKENKPKKKTNKAKTIKK
jgi:hypothetical protein